MNNLDGSIHSMLLENTISKTYAGLDLNASDRSFIVHKLKRDVSEWMKKDLTSVDAGVANKLRFLAFILGVSSNLNSSDSLHFSLLKLLQEHRELVRGLKFDIRLVLRIAFDSRDLLNELIVFVLSNNMTDEIFYAAEQNSMIETESSIEVVIDMQGILYLLDNFQNSKMNEYDLLTARRLLSLSLKHPELVDNIVKTHRNSQITVDADHSSLETTLTQQLDNYHAIELAMLILSAYKQKSKDLMKNLQLESYLILEAKRIYHLRKNIYDSEATILHVLRHLPQVSDATESYYENAYRTFITRPGYYLERLVIDAKIFNPLVMVEMLSMNIKILSVHFLRLIQAWLLRWEVFVIQTLMEDESNDSLASSTRRHQEVEVLALRYKTKLVK